MDMCVNWAALCGVIMCRSGIWHVKSGSTSLKMPLLYLQCLDVIGALCVALGETGIVS